MTAILPTDEVRYFERLADVERAHWWSRGLWRLASHWLAKALRGKTGLCALDIGCGTGLNVVRLAARSEIARVVGVDSSREALQRARRYGFTWLRGSALYLPFPDACFDVVTCFDVFQHLPAASERQAARELMRVLRPGGVALVRTNARGWSLAHAQQGPLYQLHDLKAILADAGLSVRRASFVNCVPALAQDVRDRLRHWVRRGQRPHAARTGLQIRVPPRWINETMGRWASAEAFVAGRLGRPLPFGHSALVLAQKPETP